MEGLIPITMAVAWIALTSSSLVLLFEQDLGVVVNWLLGACKMHLGKLLGACKLHL
jgi:hypothetical protein